MSKEKKFEIVFLTKDETRINSINVFLNEWESDDAFISTKTSGSTGKAKIIKIEKEQMMASAKLSNTYFHYDKIESALHALDVKTIGGKMALIRAIVYNLKLYVTDVAANPIVHLNFKIDFTAFVPLQIKRIIDETPEKLNLINSIIIGGAAVSNSLNKSLKSFSSNFYSTYGMTETVSHVAIKKLGNNEEQYFQALGLVSFKTNDLNELIINAPELSIINLKTNDLVELKNNKSFKYLGRQDFVINSGAYKINLETLEDKLSSQLKVPFFLAGLKDNELGEKLILITESKTPLNIDYSSLEKYEKPKEIIYLEKLELTVSGKIDRLTNMKKIVK